jgi:hypothetical protein
MSRRTTPGLFEDTSAAAPPSEGVRDDVAAFVGLTERGPVDRAVRLERWEDFRACFGGRSDAFLLPDVVESFFANGGSACYVVRVLHRKAGPGEQVGRPAQASCRALTTQLPDGTMGSPGWMAAQQGVEDPGTWANGTGCAVRFQVHALGGATQPAGRQTRLIFDEGAPRIGLGPGTLLWIGDAAGERFAVVIGTAWVASQEGMTQGFSPAQLQVELEAPVELKEGARVALVEATVEVRSWGGRRESFDRLGLDPRHPRYLPAVLEEGSRLVAMRVGEEVPSGTLFPVSLRPVGGQPAPGDELGIVELSGGQDGLAHFTRDDFFPAPGADEEKPETLIGLGQLYRLRDVSLVLLPDLCLPGTPELLPPAVPSRPPRSSKRARFVCGPAARPAEVPEPEARPLPASPPALIDPAVAPVSAKERAALWRDLAAAEARVVAYCEAAGDRVALLAPPPSADPKWVEFWRRGFESAFAAAYYPWLIFGDPVLRPPARRIPPTGVAAGIIARAEARSGVGRSPANLAALSVSGTARPVSVTEWGDLHEASLNLFRPEIGEVRLLGGRTLSLHRDLRYLHVRRLLTHLERVIERRMGWAAFEPNAPELWSSLRYDLDAHVLQPLFLRGAFAGDTPEKSYFIRCDETLNTRAQRDQGRIWCEIGIAPSVPAEYIVFRLSASRDAGSLVREEG